MRSSSGGLSDRQRASASRREHWGATGQLEQGNNSWRSIRWLCGRTESCRGSRLDIATREEAQLTDQEAVVGERVEEQGR